MYYCCGSAILVIALYFAWLYWEVKRAIPYPEDTGDYWPNDIP